MCAYREEIGRNVCLQRRDSQVGVLTEKRQLGRQEGRQVDGQAGREEKNNLKRNKKKHSNDCQEEEQKKKKEELKSLFEKTF